MNRRTILTTTSLGLLTLSGCSVFNQQSGSYRVRLMNRQTEEVVVDLFVTTGDESHTVYSTTKRMEARANLSVEFTIEDPNGAAASQPLSIHIGCDTHYTSEALADRMAFFLEEDGITLDHGK